MLSPLTLSSISQTLLRQYCRCCLYLGQSANYLYILTADSAQQISHEQNSQRKYVRIVFCLSKSNLSTEHSLTADSVHQTSHEQKSHRKYVHIVSLFYKSKSKSQFILYNLDFEWWMNLIQFSWLFVVYPYQAYRTCNKICFALVFNLTNIFLNIFS